MNIVKQSTGNVVLTDAAGNIQKVFVNVNALEVKGTDEVIVKFGFNQWHSLFASQIDNTQVEPAAAVAFSGNAFDLVALLSSSFFFELSGGGGSQDLASVLSNGNQSGPDDIIFDEFFGLSFDNLSRLREGTIDAGLGGQKGIAQICGAGYELKWEGGRLYVMGSSGNTIRWSLYNFNITPDVNDDNTKGYSMGSLWSLDSGAVYICGDASTGAAVWTLQQNGVPTLSQVLASGKSAGNSEIIDLDKLDFNTTPAGTAGEGQLVWNDTLGTLNLGLKGGNTISNLGQHLHARVVNKVTPNQTLTKAGYKAVKVSGAQGQRLAVAFAQGNNDANSADTIGLVCETIATNQEGFIVCVGQIEGINTTGSLQSETWADGDVLYLSPTTAGQITNIKPTGAGHIVIIGYVEYAHINQGKIYVKVMNGWELDELHDVSITSVANNDALIYESSTALWKNKTIGGWSYIVKSANQDVTNSATPQDDTELQFSVVAGGHYMVQLDLTVSASDLTGDYSGRFFVSAGTMKGNGIATILSNLSAAGSNAIQLQNANSVAQTTAFVTGAPIADLDQLIGGTVTYSFTASANATFKYQFNNSAAAAGRISRTWKGSILKYKRID